VPEPSKSPLAHASKFTVVATGSPRAVSDEQLLEQLQAHLKASKRTPGTDYAVLHLPAMLMGPDAVLAVHCEGTTAQRIQAWQTACEFVKQHDGFGLVVQDGTCRTIGGEILLT